MKRAENYGPDSFYREVPQFAGIIRPENITELTCLQAGFVSLASIAGTVD